MTQRTFMIGRDPSCDLVERNRKVSARHANLTLAGDRGLFVTDLGSSNGTFIVGNGGRERVRNATISGAQRISFGPECEYTAAELLARIAALEQPAEAPPPRVRTPQRPLRCRRCGGPKDRGVPCPICAEATKGRG